jgi:acyl-CoA thioesterase
VPDGAPSDLAVATAVQKLAERGAYGVELPEAWSYRMPSGGVLMTAALRAMRAELADDAFAPVSATTIFCTPVPAGPLEIRVHVIRRGFAASQVRAALVSPRVQGAGLEVSATFALERSGPDAMGVEMPDVPPPERCPPSGPRVRSATSPAFFANFDIRLAIGAAFSEPDWEAGEARQAYWYRYLVPQRHGGHFDPLAIPPIADTMPGALARRLGPKEARFFAPSLDLTVHFLDRSDSEWFLVDVRCQRARGGYATADAEIWDEAGHLVAHASQTMMLRRRPPEVR